MRIHRIRDTVYISHQYREYNGKQKLVYLADVTWMPEKMLKVLDRELKKLPRGYFDEIRHKIRPVHGGKRLTKSIKRYRVYYV